MTRERNPNLAILELAVDQLGELADEMVFVGGCATGLLISDEAAPPIRATKDVDAITQIATKAVYYQLSEKLRDQGFAEDASDGAPLCRWINDSVILDVMPTDPTVLGFGNEWYMPAMDKAEVIKLPSGRDIRMITTPYFLLTKLAAFDGRGNEDYLLSHDIEDFIAVIDGRPEAINEIEQSDPELVSELSERCKGLISDRGFVEAVSGHMPTDETSQARASMTIEIINKIAELK